MAWSPRQNYLAVGGKDTVLRIWDVETEKILMQIDHINGPVHALAYSNDGCYILTGGNHQPTSLWNSITGEQILNFQDIGSAGMIYNVNFNYNDKFAIISKIDRNDETSDIWKLNSLETGTTC